MPSLADAKLAYYNSKGFYGTLADCELAFFSAGGDNSATNLEGVLNTGESSWDRRTPMTTLNPLVSGILRFTCFTANRDEAINNVAMITASTAAAATPTLCKIGIYEVTEEVNRLNLITATANDITLFNTASTRYVVPLITTFNKKSGVRYAVAPLIISAFTGPTLIGLAANPNTTNDNPAIGYYVSGQNDFASSYIAAVQTALPYFELLP